MNSCLVPDFRCLARAIARAHPSALQTLPLPQCQLPADPVAKASKTFTLLIFLGLLSPQLTYLY